MRTRADAAGTKIFETLQGATSARPGRKVKVISLGLGPEEAVDMGLQVETFESDRRRPVADYVSYRWTEWLQSNRVELNAMSTPEFIKWLEGKLEEHGVGKVIPTEDVLARTFEESAELAIRSQVMKDILEQNLYEKHVEIEMMKARHQIELSKLDIRDKVSDKLADNPLHRWDPPVNELAVSVINNR